MSRRSTAENHKLSISILHQSKCCMLIQIHRGQQTQFVWCKLQNLPCTLKCTRPPCFLWAETSQSGLSPRLSMCVAEPLLGSTCILASTAARGRIRMRVAGEVRVAMKNRPCCQVDVGTQPPKSTINDSLANVFYCSWCMQDDLQGVTWAGPKQNALWGALRRSWQHHAQSATLRLRHKCNLSCPNVKRRQAGMLQSACLPHILPCCHEVVMFSTTMLHHDDTHNYDSLRQEELKLVAA